MTIRAATLDRVPTELLLDRLRKAPDCLTTLIALERRGAVDLANEVRCAEQADRELEAEHRGRSIRPLGWPTGA